MEGKGGGGGCPGLCVLVTRLVASSLLLARSKVIVSKAKRLPITTGDELAKALGGKRAGVVGAHVVSNRGRVVTRTHTTVSNETGRAARGRPPPNV